MEEKFVRKELLFKRVRAEIAQCRMQAFAVVPPFRYLNRNIVVFCFTFN